MPFLFQAPPGLAFFNCTGIRLMLDRPEAGTDEAAIGTSIIYYKVPNIDIAYASLKSKGASFVDQPHKIADMPDHELWMVFLHDSEGNMLGLMSEKPLA
jgi:methylmalonyl-CoA/ethylmalonyl-CoA epimerase